MIETVPLDTTLPPRTHIYRTIEAWMQDYALSLSSPFVQGDFSQDTYMASIRQQSYSSHPDKKVYGFSRVVRQSYEQSYRSSMPLHSNF
eukprot:SAG31_NODE_38825_length_293_cov_0.783505_1_plen_88_part_01